MHIIQLHRLVNLVIHTDSYRCMYSYNSWVIANIDAYACLMLVRDLKMLFMSYKHNISCYRYIHAITLQAAIITLLVLI